MNEGIQPESKDDQPLEGVAARQQLRDINLSNPARLLGKLDR